ncbi:hypothetical protein PF002_g31436 [Phytophthora fragariae]|uniref:ANK_REP_REGION domain-containing protein n=2 Tax=Phytophthora fragariae TaxID=53985 RepID=A0A6A3VGH5_9STRA|nr:hypothetical protein PF006_g30897 [Phytophthora fragariae]KAE9165116.1 hypothetical protein PF002_g31436 [Phytophthora fragariae]
MVQALLDHADHQAIEKALRKTVKSGNDEISKMLISRLAPNSHERIFQNAALSGCVGVLRLLLGQMKSCSIHCALICAAAWGHTEVVAELLEKSDSSAISCALQFAAVEAAEQQESAVGVNATSDSCNASQWFFHANGNMQGCEFNHQE